jgi:nickel-type superoxide dismutase maturation protease
VNLTQVSTVVIGLAAAAVVAARPRRVRVEGPSMLPTLFDGDRLLVARTRRVRPGDVVALRLPGDSRRVLVKRVERRVPDGVLVLGDNPAASTDSRDFGPVPVGAVLGRVVRRYFPPERAGPVR